MKASKIIVPIIMIGLLGLAWLSYFMGVSKNQKEYKECLAKAEESVDKGLYEQAVEYYKKALEFNSRESIYEDMKVAYDLLYAEEPIAYVRNIYLEDMKLASNAFPEKEMFWDRQIELYLDADNYKGAYETAKSALNKDVTSDKLDKMYNKLLYMTKLEYKVYEDYNTALNGYISLYNGNTWSIVSDAGEVIRDEYKYIGLINDDGKGLHINDIDTRILDAGEITRSRFDMAVEEAGYYNETVDLLPVKVDGVWKYINAEGKALKGEYQIAGSFYGEEAVAYTGEDWVIVDTEGKTEKLKGFEDVKLDLYGCHNQNGIVIAKNNGKYHLYNAEFEQIGDFAADDMDICVNSSYIAYKKGDKWGFVDVEGNIVCEPKFANAKSFANKYAAVCNADGMWGFINSSFEVIIDYEYADAHYFNAAERCLVSTNGEGYQFLKYYFEN